MEMEILSRAINELVRLLTKNRRLRRTELVKVLDQTLKGFDAILENKKVLQEAEEIHKRGDNAKRSELISDLRKFQDAFLSMENRALQQINVKKDSRKVIEKKLRLLRKDDIDSLVNSSKPLRKMLEEARDVVLELLDLLEKPDIDFTIKRDVENNLRKVLSLAIGVAIVGINAAFLVTNPIPSTISVAFGSGLISKQL